MINYFELYDMPETFRPPKPSVKAKFYELSRQYHPDRFAQADATARAEALRMAALNNDAYKTLNEPDAVMAYLLKAHGLLEEEEKYNLPPDFLMEMMDVNEIVSEYEMEPDNLTARQQAEATLQSQLEEWQQNMAPLIDRFEGGERDKALLLQIKDHYFRKKYLLRIQERMNTFASH